LVIGGIMSKSIKEIIIKFFILFLVYLIIGYFIKSLEMNILKAVAISFGITLFDLMFYAIRKYKKRN
jgi:hypothetical protein